MQQTRSGNIDERTQVRFYYKKKTKKKTKHSDSPGDCRPTTEIIELCSANKALEGEGKMIQLSRPITPFSSSSLQSILSLFKLVTHTKVTSLHLTIQTLYVRKNIVITLFIYFYPVAETSFYSNKSFMQMQEKK